MNRRQGRLSDASAVETPQGKLVRRATTGGSATPSTPVQEPAERVKVFVRVRPPHPHETAGGVALEGDEETIVLQRIRNVNVAQTDFKFDKVLNPEATQAEVYEAAAKPIVEDVLKGYNGTVMAYGQTGAGKTYTLSSVQSADNIGMMPRAAAHIFSEIAADSSHVYNVMMAYIQIYQELIQDLLKPENENLQIREGSNGVFIAGVEEQPVRSMTDCLRLMQLGEQNRRVAFTQLNATSSRSHAIVMLTVIKRRRGSDSTTPGQQKMKVGKLFIVDLAGSERLKKSQSTGQRANEAKAINLSLTTLGICINARADPNSKHVPFRDSKLTRLLQESLGGNTKTSLVVAVANAVEHADETLQSLQFGSRAMHVQIKAVVNESVGSKLLNAELLESLSNLEIRPCLVDASLLAKEEELERIQEALQGERDKAAKIIAALQAEKESAEAHKERELSAAQERISQQQQEAEKQECQLKKFKAETATLAAQHQEALLQLEDKLLHAGELYRQLQAEKAEGEREAKQKLQHLVERHQEQMDDMRLSHGRELAAAAQLRRQEVDGVRGLLRHAEEEQQRLQNEILDVKGELEVERKEMQESLALRVKETEQAAEARVAVERQDSLQQVLAKEQLAERTAAALSDSQSQLETLQRQFATLADDHSVAIAEAASLRASLDVLEKDLAGTRGQLSKAEKQVTALERSSEQYKALWMSNKRLNDAARVIQRRYKLWRMCVLRNQSSRDAQALAIAHRDKCSLEGQKVLMERDQHQHSVWAGQALVAASLNVLEEAVQQIRTAFLLPSKELKTLGHLKSRMSPGLSGSPRAANFSPSPLSRALSFVSDASGSGPSFVTRGGGTPESALGRPSAVKHVTPNEIAAFSNGIQAHWGTPTNGGEITPW